MNDNVDGILIMKINNFMIKVIFLCFFLFFDVNDVILIFNIEIVDVIVVKKNSNKKMMKNNFLNVILLKIVGNMINNSFGFWDGFILNVNIIGKIVSFVSNVIIRVKVMIENVECGKFFFFGKYELYVIIMVILIDNEKNDCFIVYKIIFDVICEKLGCKKKWMFFLVLFNVSVWMINIKNKMNSVGMKYLFIFLILFCIFLFMMKIVIRMNNSCDLIVKYGLEMILLNVVLYVLFFFYSLFVIVFYKYNKI